MLEAITGRLSHGKRGISTVIVVMLSLVLIVIVVSNVILWSYQMNQLDLERMQEKVTVANITRATRSAWFTAQNEFTTSAGSLLGGTYMDTQTVDGNFETFREESNLINDTYNPSSYTLLGSTKYVSGVTADLTTDNSVYMIFKSYSSAFSSQPLYSHSEVTTIAGTPYYQLRLSSADTSGTTFSASAATTGRKLLAKSVYSLSGITSVPASIWTLYYRAYKTGSDSQILAHCDADILIRKADNTVRTTFATGVANSPNLNRDTYTTVSATYVWNSYTVVDDTDYLEVDYYAHVTSSQSGRNVYLRVDDSSLAITDQTRITNLSFPNQFTVEVELAGSGNTQNWLSLTWTLDNAFTMGDVNVTLQLYNHNIGLYPASGDGYVAYVSGSTPNVDETRNQTITVNPAYYRNSTGEWKMKITGVKQASSPVNLKIDRAEYKTTAVGIYRLDVNNDFTIDLSTLPLNYIHSIEMTVRYNATQNGERWFLKAYNWTALSFSDSGFNNTGGNQPVLSMWNDYAVNVAGGWRDYVNDNGTLLIELRDEGLNTTQTIVGIDFFGVDAVINGTRFDMRNSSPFTTHIVAIWMLNSTYHQRYDVDMFINSGEEATYIRADISLPETDFAAKIVTEKGNTAVYP